jgi:hypothetical protein
MSGQLRTDNSPPKSTALLVFNIEEASRFVLCSNNANACSKANSFKL